MPTGGVPCGLTVNAGHSYTRHMQHSFAFPDAAHEAKHDCLQPLTTSCTQAPHSMPLRSRLACMSDIPNKDLHRS